MNAWQRNAWQRLSIAVAVLLSVAAAHAQDTPALAISKANRTMAITATESVKRMADIGVVHIGFEQYAPTKDAAYAAGSKASNAIVDALVHAGVKRETIQSETQEIGETQFYNGQPGTPASERQAKAFHVRQTWTVRVAADDAARTLDLAVKGGANASGQIDWALSDPNAAQAEAASKAIQRAQSQAKSMASGLGVHLGDLLYASNQVEGSPVLPSPRRLEKMAVASQTVELPLAINPREVDTAATVYAVFALEP